MSPAQRVFVTGATGLVGRKLCRALLGRGDSVVAVTRKGTPGKDAAGIEWLQGDLNRDGDPLFAALSDCDAVVHLAGEPIAGGRWTAARKRRLVESRVATTKRLVAAASRSERPPTTWLVASAVGFYGARGDEVLDEKSPGGSDFLAQLCRDWEAAAAEARNFGARVVSLRLGVVLSPKGGALRPLALGFRLGLGGPLGPRSNWFPWIHEDDTLAALLMALDRPLSGPVNLVAPEPATMGEFAKALGTAVRRPSWLPVPEAVLRIGLGELTDAVIPSQRVLPKALIAAGFEFCQPTAAAALCDCLGARS